MRLLHLDIGEFRSIKDEWIPANGLVVLFGPNSAGKTTVLEAVEQLLTEAENFRSDPGDPNGEYLHGCVTFDLPHAGTTEGPDARMYRRLLAGEYNREGVPHFDEAPWNLLKQKQIDQLKDLGVPDIISLLADPLEGAGTAGTADDRSLLARSVFDANAVFFTAEWSKIHLWSHGPSLPRGAMDAARRIAAFNDDGDALWTIANDLVGDGSARITRLADGIRSQNTFPRVIVLDGGSDSLAAELQRTVPSIHDRLWYTKPEVVGSGEYQMESVDSFPIHTLHRGDGGYDEDRWLEGLSEDGQPVLPDFFRSPSAGGWYRVRHSILAAAEIIASEANKVAPGFVAEQGTISIEVLPVSLWGDSVPRVRAAFAEHGEGPRDLSVLGAGTARWVAAAIRLACRRLLAGRQVVTDDVGMIVTDEAEQRRIVMEARHEPFTQRAVRLEPSDAVAVYIADEPEAHLHPAALHSVRQWLMQLAGTAATVLVATHSAALLDSTSELVHRVLVTREGRRTHLQHMTGAIASELARVADDLGLSRGELLLMTRLALFVEGPHDQIILDEWFGDTLRAAGIRVFPVHGVDHLPGLAESEIIAALGIRIATLSDETSLSRVSSGNPDTRGEHAVTRLLAEAARRGIEVRSIGLNEPDILWYLNETVCQRNASAFPGWATARAERSSARSKERGRDWKEWIERRYDLPLTRDNIRQLARMCREEGSIPNELIQKINELAVYASAAPPRARAS